MELTLDCVILAINCGYTVHYLHSLQHLYILGCLFVLELRLENNHGDRHGSANTAYVSIQTTESVYQERYSNYLGKTKQTNSKREKKIRYEHRSIGWRID